MFDNLSQRLQQSFKRLRGEGRLTEENMRDTLREIRVALLEADVAVAVVKAFIDRVRERAAGQEVLTSLTPGQALVKVVHDELVALMGDHNDALNLAARPPAVVLFAGLQGAGKTTTVAKLARRLRTRDGKSVMVVSTDVQRPAAIEQLRKLAQANEVAFFESDPRQSPLKIAGDAVEAAHTRLVDVLLIDSAGRLHVDDAMMQEIQALHAAAHPIETLFVVDSMAGQDAVNAAQAFNAALPLTGVILTKADGDARGGAALSVRYVTGKPIKFLGVGEASDALEPFYPDRIASRILGMGDVLSLVEEAQHTVDRDKAERLAQKLKKGKGLTLEDFRDQLLQMERMGGMAGLLDRLPGADQLPAAAREQASDAQMKRLVAIINSMTPQERRTPDIIRGSRKRRIATGSGTQVQDVNRMLKQFTEMERMMKQLRKGGMQRLLSGMRGRMPGLS
jgi:signal recognition particle subunit SRP54